MLLAIFKISGHSMIPKLSPGDRVVVSNIPYLFIKPGKGEVVLFQYNGKMLVKRIVRIENKRYYLEGDNKPDNLKVEPIEQKNILGKVLWNLL